VHAESSAAVGSAWWHLLAPFSVAVVTMASWRLRPRDRTLGDVRAAHA